jgi:hypothetical protein
VGFVTRGQWQDVECLLAHMHANIRAAATADTPLHFGVASANERFAALAAT